MAQEPSSEFLLAAPGIQHRVPRRTVALHPAPADGLRRTVVHEITHAYLSHLRLPLWLEEGITQRAEVTLQVSRPVTLEPEEVQRTRRYWREHSLQDFWWGAGFYAPGEGQGCSYRLAEILFHLISVDHRPQIPHFLGHAHHDDAGDSAASKFLGKDLATLAAQFLGPGAWQPVPPDGAAYLRRGVFYSTRGMYHRAVADFSRAIEHAPTSAEPYTNRGLAHYHLGRYAAAITDYETAIRLSPEQHLAHNNLAWVLATCPQDEMRDGGRAVEHASRACELSGFEVWYCLGTLAAAYAEAGDFAEAQEYAKVSLRRAPEGERTGCKERLQLYKREKPYRETPPR
jgi:hypothetical protein